MVASGKRWILQDRDGRPIYLTEERWEHIIDDENHPEMIDMEEQLKTTIRQGRRSQEPQDSRKYRYIHQFDDLPAGSTHIMAIVMFGFTYNGYSNEPNN